METLLPISIEIPALITESPQADCGTAASAMSSAMKANNCVKQCLAKLVALLVGLSD